MQLLLQKGKQLSQGADQRRRAGAVLRLRRADLDPVNQAPDDLQSLGAGDPVLKQRGQSRYTPALELRHARVDLHHGRSERAERCRLRLEPGLVALQLLQFGPDA